MQNKRYKLLIVDDDVLQLKKMSTLFKEGFECFEAASGEAAFDIFKQEAPHAILSDVKMPGGISGFELCKRVKSISPETIVMIASSYNNTAMRILGYKSRADEYINKTINDQEMYLKVRNLVYTKYNIPAVFSNDEATSLMSINSFEDEVKAILYEYYETPIHFRSATKIDLDTIANKLHKSNRTIQRDFAREVGSTFGDFHNQIRLRIAAQLLINTDRSISEISEDLCFSSPSVLSQSFRAVHGVTPSKYRHNYLDEE